MTEMTKILQKGWMIEAGTAPENRIRKRQRWTTGGNYEQIIKSIQEAQHENNMNSEMREERT